MAQFGEIVSNVAVQCIINVVIFLFFYIGLPYMQGKEMETLSESNIYQYIYLKLTGVGFILYRVIEWFKRLLTSRVRREWVVCLVDIAIYTFVVAMFTSFYGSMVDSFVTSNGAELSMKNSEFGHVSDLLAVVQVYRSYLAASDGGVLGAIWPTIWACITFGFQTLIYFTLLYGILQKKLHNVKLCEIFGTLSDAVTEWGKGNIAEMEHCATFWDRLLMTSLKLLVKIATAILDFLRELSILNSLGNLMTMLVVTVAIVIFTVVKSIFSYLPSESISSLVFIMLDEVNLMDLIISFLLSLLQAFVLVLLGKGTYKVMPESVKASIDNFDEWAGAKNEEIRASRNAYAESNDANYAEDYSSRMNKMNF